MSNTMMSFLAMMLMMFFALNQNRAIVESQRQAAAVELEVLASGVAAQSMQYIASRDFDDNMAQIDPQNPDLNLLTHPDDFPTGVAWNDMKNLEDFHLMQPDTAYVTIGSEEIEEGQEPVIYTFTVQAAVNYVDAQGNESNTPTWTKEVTLYIERVVPEGSTAVTGTPVIKKRRFSPDWGA